MSLSTERLADFLKKNPVSVGCGILTLVLLGTVYWRSDHAADAQTKLEEKTSEAERISTNLKNAAQLKEHFDAVAGAQKQIEGRLIQAKNLTANSQYFYKLESETGVKLLDIRQSSITAAAKKEVKVYLPTVFTLNVQGDYTQLLTFLRRLESGAHYCRVMTASCNPGADRGAGMTLTLNLELLGQP